MPLITWISSYQPQNVILYPTGPDTGTTEAVEEGISPSYFPTAAHSSAATLEATPGVAWSRLFTLLPQGTLTVLSIYVEFEWRARFVAGAGGGTTSSRKVQVSSDGGTTWVDTTDNFNTTAATLTNRIRAATGQWVTSVTGQDSRFGVRLVHWQNGTGADRSEAQIRTNSYIRLTYVKS